MPWSPSPSATAHPSAAAPARGAQRIAVIGGGIAGLAAGHWLARAGCAVTLFESQPRPGFVAHTTEIDGARVDMPLRVFYRGYYPTLAALYDELGVASEPVSYASTFTDAQGAPFFRYRNLRMGGASWSWVAPQDLFDARARRVLGAALRFHRDARTAQARGTLDGASIGAWVAQRGYAREFVDGLLLPSIATVCTCPTEAAAAFPARVVIDYLRRGVTREAVRRARHGADDAARRLLAGLAEVRCAATVVALMPEPIPARDGASDAARNGAHDGTPDAARAGHRESAGPRWRVHLRDGTHATFDHVVLATQANQALRLLPPACTAEAAALRGFSYRPVEVVMHRDPALMPPRRADWSAVNLRVDPRAAQPQSTIWINAVQPGLRDAAPVFQTVHPHREPAAATVLARAHFERPVVDRDSERALAALGALHAQPGRTLWFCGSYAQPGIPLLESAVRSARVVADIIRAA